MASTVFILGSGVSKHAGAPLMGEFLDVSHDLLRLGKVDSEIKHFERVFKYRNALQSVHSKARLDINNIEEVFSALEMSKIIGWGIPSFKQFDYDQTIESIRHVIATTLDMTICFPCQNASLNWLGTTNEYREFAKLINLISDYPYLRETVSIITFNYDLCIDNALLESGRDIDYGFDDGKRAHRACFGNPVKLLKLHGSLNWGHCNCGKIERIYLDEYFGPDHLDGFNGTNVNTISKLTSHTHDYLGCNGILESAPFIVPPTWSKIDKYAPLSKVWSSAANELSGAENIFVLGYSLPYTDSFFKLLYSLGSVGNNPLKKFQVFNPDKTVENRFKELLGPGALSRFKYKKIIFENSIDAIGELLLQRKVTDFSKEDCELFRQGRNSGTTNQHLNVKD